MTESSWIPSADDAPSGPRLAELPAVARTAVIPLLARHLASSRPDPIITDPTASALIGTLRLSSLAPDWTFRAVEVGTAVRTELLDAATARFAAAHPHSRVVTVGVGLCTRHARLAALDVTWIEIDLPELAALRGSVLPPGPDRTIIAESALDTGWRRQLADDGDPILFILEGLTMYLTEESVRELLTDLAERFPGSDILVEAVGPRTRQPSRYKGLAVVAPQEAPFTWGVADLAELTGWHPHLQLLETWYLMDHHPTAWPALIRVLRHLPSVRTQSKIGYFRIRADQPA